MGDAVAVCLIICIQETLLLALPKIQLPEIGAGIVTRLRVESGFDSQLGKKNLSLLHSIQTGSGAHPASYPVGTECFLSGKIGRNLKLHTYLHLV
jgi:hypothetical protein